jgi:hypothetical protein
LTKEKRKTQSNFILLNLKFNKETFMNRRTFIQTLGAVCLPSFDPGLFNSKWLTAAGRGFKTRNTDNPGGGYYGVINHQGEIVIPPRFKHWFGFSEGLADIISDVNSGYDGKSGYIDMTGDWVIPPTFDVAGDFNEGLAPVIPDGEKGKWGFINRTGELVIPAVFDQICEFSDGLACVGVGGVRKNGVWENGKWGYIDQTGTWVIPPVYNDAGPFSQGLAPIVIDREWGYINPVGQVVIEPVLITPLY